MRLELLPHGGYVLPKDVSTDVFTALRRMMSMTRERPERLATVCYAYSWCGWWWGWLGSEIAISVNEATYVIDEPGAPSGWVAMTDEEGFEIARSALAYRRPQDLRRRAEGLLLGLEMTAGPWAQALLTAT